MNAKIVNTGYCSIFKRTEVLLQAEDDLEALELHKLLTENNFNVYPSYQALDELGSTLVRVVLADNQEEVLLRLIL